MLSLKSEVTQKLLSYFFLNPEESLYVNELARKLDLDKRNLVKKIKELERDGILKSSKRGNLKLYSIDKKYPLYKEYKNIVLKTIGFEKKIKEILKKIKGVKKAYIYGSYAQDKMDTHSDIDLLVIGDYNMLLLQKGIAALQSELDREINIVNIDSKEFDKRCKKKDPFISGIFKNRHIILI